MIIKKEGGGGEWHGNWKYVHGMTIATTLAKALQISSGRTTAPKGNEPAILTKKTIVKLTILICPVCV